MEEGYIKYRCIHTSGPAPKHELLEDLNALRTDLYHAGLIGVLPNGVGFGNVSVRKQEGFVITATATGGAEVLPMDGYTYVSECDIDNNTVQSCGPAEPSSESMTHAAVYAAAPEIHCVIHLHNKEFFAMLLQGKAPATDGEAAFGTPAMARSVEELVRQHPSDGVIAMTGHPDGFLVYGPTVDHVRDLIYMLSQGYIPC